jgi:glyoxylase-like metal-dependent hydrolase (beta-lactamase superfamily II)
MITIKVFTFNNFAENTYVLSDETKSAIIIDPGCYTSAERKELSDYILQENLVVEKLVNTHAHIDHILGNNFVQKTYQVPFYLHRLDLPILKAATSRAAFWGFGAYVETLPDLYLEEGENVNFGNSSLEVLFTPGHAAGHVVFVNRDDNFCICGDVIFKGAIGRTDFEFCNQAHLIQSIKEKIFNLPDEMLLFPGHGTYTTVLHEKETNPYVGKNGLFS